MLRIVEETIAIFEGVAESGSENSEEAFMQDVIARIILATSVVFLLTVSMAGAALNAGASTGIIDDTAPGWVWNGMTEYDDPGLYGGQAHAGGPGGYGSFTFTGTGVEVVGVASPTIQVDGHVHRTGSLKISIDGKEQNTASTRRPSTEYNFSVGQITGLTRGIHVLEVAPEDGWAMVDYIRVIDPSGTVGADGTAPQAEPAKPAVTRLGTPVFMLNAGGQAIGDWAGDANAYGGTVASSSEPVNTSAIPDPAPEAVYQSERWGACGYIVPNLKPGTTYNVRLDFAETYYWRPTMRRFDVAINNKIVLNDFDIFTVAGGKDRAIAEVFPVVADDEGKIAIGFLKGQADQPCICAIAVYKP
jgi:hypothetical protein